MGKVKRLGAAVAAVFWLAGSLHVGAESLNTQLGDVKSRLEQQKEQIGKAQRQVDSVSEQIRVLQEELRAATEEYQAVRAELERTEEQIAANEVILEKAEADLAKRMQILNKRVRDIYQNGQISYIDVLFGANDFNDFMTRMDLLKRVIKHDYDLIMAVRQERALILEKKAALERDRDAIKALEQEAAAKRQAVEASKERKQELLDRATNDRDEAERMYQELLETSKQIEQMIRQQARSSVSGGSAAGSTGSMIWPVHGVITSEYGWRTHPIFGTSKYHSGLDIGADYGDTIVAADGGTVIYAGWLGGYGNAVIIDHGGGLTTLYGHNDSLLVGEGQQIGQGQAIALCGSTGYSTGPHCHFEVRVDGSPVDPYGYL